MSSLHEQVSADLLSHELSRFVRLVHHVRTHVHPDGAHSIERSAYTLLGVLCKHGPMRMTALAAAVHADPSTVSRQVGSLVAHGLVERRSDPADGRGSALVPTTEGVRVFDENRAWRREWLCGLLGDWPEGERDELVRLLAKLNTELETHDWERA